MKKLKGILLGLSILALSSSAFAFITVIDVEERPGEYRTVQSEDDYSFNQMEGKSLSYRGQPIEAANLFERVVRREFPLSSTIVENEINGETGTIAITVAINGYLGFEYQYYVLVRSSH